MRPKVLLVNPPIHDFSAYDFWLKPYGLLRVAGYLRGQAELRLFDFLDRWHACASAEAQARSDAWGRGPFAAQEIDKPARFAHIPRRYRRYGRPRQQFEAFLAREGPFDAALVQTVMTYWYPGVREVIETLRAAAPHTQIILGGVYATLCPQHARDLGADLVVEGARLEPLWHNLGVAPRLEQIPLWEAYACLPVGILKLADGCPFRCTYCAVPQVYPPFAMRLLERSHAELGLLSRLGVRNVAFYDDALLYRPNEILLPFLDRVERQGLQVQFHTPNALNARFLTREVAAAMVRAGFKTFYLGFESAAYGWQKRTGGKVYANELVRAVEHLAEAGADRRQITAYLILAHPQSGEQDVATSMQFASSLGIRVMLSEFSPIPGTPDGERCRQWVDLDEPLWHNKTVFAMTRLGVEEVQRLKTLCRDLNQQVAAEPSVRSGA